MPFFKLLNALPQSVPGSIEPHYGYNCEIRNDGVYINLKDEATIANFKVAGRIDKPVEEVKQTVKQPESVKVEESVVQVEDKPQTMTEVMENGSGKRAGRPAKDK